MEKSAKVNSKIRTTPAEKSFTVVNTILLTLIALICLYPMLYVAFASVSNSNLLTQRTFLFGVACGQHCPFLHHTTSPKESQYKICAQYIAG